MLVEQRMVWLDLNDVSTDADILSFGDEGCITPFLDVANHWYDFLKVLEKGVRIKMILPRVSQKELSPVINLLQKILALKRNIEFVLNDWGVLFFLSKIDTSVIIHLGRQICRTLLDCPWHDEVLMNETSTIKKIISSHPYEDKERLMLLKKNCVHGLEINAFQEEYSFEIFSNENIETAVNSDSYLLTCGNTCLIKRAFPDMSCPEVCGEKVDITMSGKWLSFFEHSMPLTKYERALLSGMSVIGKKVLLPQKMNVEQLISCGADVIITSHKYKVEYLRRIQS